MHFLIIFLISKIVSTFETLIFSDNITMQVKKKILVTNVINVTNNAFFNIHLSLVNMIQMSWVSDVHHSS